MKILIIEDENPLARMMGGILAGLGEVVLCTSSSLEEVNFKISLVTMPPIGKVRELINEADIVLLDSKLKTDYTGEELLPYCRGKKVISISRDESFDKPHFDAKDQITPDRPHVGARLRALVSKELGIS